MTRIIFVLIWFVFISCGYFESIDEKPTQEGDKWQHLYWLIDQWIEKSEEIRDLETGWLCVKDCDGIIWAGKYASSPLVKEKVNIRAAEYPSQPGKYTRRPLSSGLCWSEQLGDQGSQTNWSRDMATAGLLPYAFFTGQREILEQHAAYGEKNHFILDGLPLWQMGEPLNDGRTVYTPGLVGLVYQLIYAMGGEDNSNRRIPNIFISGLDDYQAHLAVMHILLLGEASIQVGDADSIPAQQDEKLNLLSISGVMFKRLKEHAERESNCPLYLATYHRYHDGIYDSAIDALDNEYLDCEYIRCGDDQQCHLAEKIFVATLLTRWHNED